MSGTTMHMVPDWVMLGVDCGAEGVMLYASSELTEAELRVVERPNFVDAWPPSSGRFQSHIDYIVLSTNMKTYVWVRGATYADAIRTLFERWTPGDRGGPAIDAQPALRP